MRTDQPGGRTAMTARVFRTLRKMSPTHASSLRTHAQSPDEVVNRAGFPGDPVT